MTRKLLNIPYSKNLCEYRLLDLFIPEKPNEAGILFVHGGGWQGGRRDLWHPLMEYFASRGYLCASASYRLAPHYIFPAAFEDIRLAMAWLQNNASSYGADSAKIAAWGSSAGAHLCSLLGTVQPHENTGVTNELENRNTLPAAVVSYAGVYLLARNGMPPVLRDVTDKFLGGDELATEEKTKDASPLLHVCGKEPPFAIFVGEYDEVIPRFMHEQMVTKLKEYGTEVEFYIVKGMQHGLGYDVKSEIEKQNTYIVENFLKHHLKPMRQ